MTQENKPTIRTITIPNSDKEDERTIIEINRGQLVAEVIGFGNGDAKFRVTGRDAMKLMAGLADCDMPAPDDDGWLSMKDYGIALVYVEPVTFAHVILDLYANT